MGGVDVGEGGGKKRATNSDINMIPFIDLLMCTIAFLLITAVWVTQSRINADAQVPGNQPCDANGCGSNTEKVLHVTVGEGEFTLTWKQGSTVVSENKIPKTTAYVEENGQKVLRYKDLADTLAKEWSREKQHSDPTDRKQDQITLHTDDRLPYRDIVAVLDAISSTKRDLRMPDGRVAKVSVFNPTFAVR